MFTAEAHRLRVQRTRFGEDPCALCHEPLADRTVLRLANCQHLMHLDCYGSLVDFHARRAASSGDTSFACPLCREVTYADEQPQDGTGVFPPNPPQQDVDGDEAEEYQHERQDLNERQAQTLALVRAVRTERAWQLQPLVQREKWSRERDSMGRSRKRQHDEIEADKRALAAYAAREKERKTKEKAEQEKYRLEAKEKYRLEKEFRKRNGGRL